MGGIGEIMSAIFIALGVLQIVLFVCYCTKKDNSNKNDDIEYITEEDYLGFEIKKPVLKDNSIQMQEGKKTNIEI